MRKLLVLWLCAMYLLTPLIASAHTADQPPYLMIGGKYTSVYPVYGSSVNEINIPNDIAVDTFLLNTPVVFSINEENLPIPQEMLSQVQFSWDFGDGTKVFGGLAVSHPYKKIGSYITSVSAIPPGEVDNEPILLQSTMLHVVPTKDYRIPQAVLLVNDKKITRPLVDVIHYSLTQPITFDASNSKGEAQIVGYQWDFGDKTYRETSQGKITYQYQLEKYKYGLPIAFVVVRVKDANGFLSDTYAQIDNDQAVKTSPKGIDTQKISLYLGIALVLIGVISLTVKKLKKQ